MRRRSSTHRAPSITGALQRRVFGAVTIALGCLLLAGCGGDDEGGVAAASVQSPDVEEPTLFPFDPEFGLTLEQHEEMRSCIVTKLGMSIESEEDDDRAWRALVVCSHELGHEDLYWADQDAQFRDALRGVTVDGDPSFLEQLSPSS